MKEVAGVDDEVEDDLLQALMSRDEDEVKRRATWSFSTLRSRRGRPWRRRSRVDGGDALG